MKQRDSETRSSYKDIKAITGADGRNNNKYLRMSPALFKKRFILCESTTHKPASKHVVYDYENGAAAASERKAPKRELHLKCGTEHEDIIYVISRSMLRA